MKKTCGFIVLAMIICNLSYAQGIIMSRALNSPGIAQIMIQCKGENGNKIRIPRIVNSDTFEMESQDLKKFRCASGQLMEVSAKEKFESNWSECPKFIYEQSSSSRMEYVLGRDGCYQ